MSWQEALTAWRTKMTGTAAIALVVGTIAATTIMVLAAIPRADAQKGSTISGLVKAVDGDTFFIGPIEIRLHGFDTPEEGKVCGAVDVYGKADAAIRSLVNGKQVTCTDTGQKNGGRVVADCSVNGRDIGEQMVALGWARDWPKFSKGRYCPMEREARAARRGLWDLNCPPDLWSDNRGPRNYINPKTKKVCE